jgi:hypothetical protein
MAPLMMRFLVPTISSVLITEAEALVKDIVIPNKRLNEYFIYVSYLVTESSVLTIFYRYMAIGLGDSLRYSRSLAMQ